MSSMLQKSGHGLQKTGIGIIDYLRFNYLQFTIFRLFRRSVLSIQNQASGNEYPVCVYVVNLSRKVAKTQRSIKYPGSSIKSR